MSLDDLKAGVCAAIDARRDTIVGISREIASQPETGFKEFKTAKTVANAFREYGLEPREGLAITMADEIVDEVGQPVAELFPHGGAAPPEEQVAEMREFLSDVSPDDFADPPRG